MRALITGGAGLIGSHIADLLIREGWLVRISTVLSRKPTETVSLPGCHLISDITRIRSLGFTPEVDLEGGIARYLDWIRAQADVRDYFAAAESFLRSKGIVHQVQRGIGA